MFLFVLWLSLEVIKTELDLFCILIHIHVVFATSLQTTKRSACYIIAHILFQKGFAECQNSAAKVFSFTKVLHMNLKCYI